MFEEFLDKQKSWFNVRGPDSKVVISSRLRLARNLKDCLFPGAAPAAQRYEVREKIRVAAQGINELKDAVFVKMEDVSVVDRKFLLERHLISQEHTISPGGKGLIVARDETLSIMINEEDHIRMQFLTPGFDLERSWDFIDKLDDELSQKLTFAFSPDIGYLTSCPTNVGTALRASCMLHLPALVLIKKINKILELLAKLSFTARGLFGEGTQALGNFFQVSNQLSLGASEEELIENLSGIVTQVKEQEEQARALLLGKHKMTVMDKVWRALGLLKHARLITTKEALSHLSMLYLGLDLGIIKGIKRELISHLFIVMQPAHLQKMEKKALREGERDCIRADLLRKSLGG